MSGHIALSFSASEGEKDALEGFFLTHSTLAGIEESSKGTLTFFIPGIEWSVEFQKSLNALCAEHPEIEFLGSEEVPDRDWNAEWESTVLPQRATEELIISPSWHLAEAQNMGSRYVIAIDPKMSFGTGHHETTRLCLKAIEGIDVRGTHVLDLGTGTGVLAIYALLRGGRDAVGIDTDSWSIHNAEENRVLNNISDSQFEIRQGTLETATRTDEAFDIIFANLHRNLLLENRELIRDHATPGAWIILSGILMYDSAEIRAAYRDPFEFGTELRENEWSCLVFRKKN